MIQAVLLAAGAGKRFGRRTKKLPKCLIPLDRRGTCLLERYFEAFRQNGLREVVIVVGHEKKQIVRAAARFGAGLSVRFIENDRYREGSLVSLYKAGGTLCAGPSLVMDADVFFPPALLGKLLRARASSAFLYDPRSKSAGEEMMLMGKRGRPLAISKNVGVYGRTPLQILGEATGIVKWSASHGRRLAGILADFVRRGRTRVEYEEAYDALLKKTKIGLVPVGNVFWSEMDFEEDLRKIKSVIPAKAGIQKRLDPR